MPQVFNDDMVSEYESLRIYRAAAKRCGDVDWRDAHPLAFITSLIYDTTMPPRIRLDSAKEALKYVMSPMTPERGLIIDAIPIEKRFPQLQILLNAPEDRPN